MIREAILLAGGPGTRLQPVVPNLPKCLAPVAGRPFIDWVLHYLAGQGIVHFILALGYGADQVRQYVTARFPEWQFHFSVETAPLGTGGAIASACRYVQGPCTLVANGDTLYQADTRQALTVLKRTQAECALFVKQLRQADRYGTVQVADNGLIRSFTEKRFFEEGLINGGLYALQVPAFLRRSFPPQFSFEKDYLEALVPQGCFAAIPDEGYFIDIGVPEDYERANRELAGIKPL